MRAQSVAERPDVPPPEITRGTLGTFAFPTGNECRVPGCQKLFVNAAARRRHERRQHGGEGR